MAGIPDDSLKGGLTSKQHQYIDELSRSIRFGTITLVFQNGVLIQVDKNEKIRLPRELLNPAPPAE